MELLNDIKVYTITTSKLYVERSGHKTFHKVKNFTQDCIYIDRDYVEKLVNHLEHTYPFIYNNLKITEYTLMNGELIRK